MTTAPSDGIALKSKTILRIALFVFAQSTLWLGGLLAVCGLFQSSSSFPENEALPMTIALIFWGASLLLLSHASSPLERIRFHALVIPALLSGLALPFPWMGVYVLFLVFLEILRTRTGSVMPRGSRSIGEPEEEVDDEIPDENVLQQTTRSRTENGKDRIEGTFLLEYLDDQLTATLHVPFVPPFATTPAIDVFLLDDDGAKPTVGPPQPFGVRIDVKRENIDAPSRLRLAVIAEG